MIKIGIRNNLLYPFMSIIFTYARKIETIVIGKIFGFNGSLLLTLIMFLAEIFSGCFFYVYQKKNIFKKRKQSKYFGIKLIEAPHQLKAYDSPLKIYLYILVIAFMDFFEFIIDTLYVPRFTDISKTLFIRLRTILTLFSGINSRILLKIKIYKHQKLSLLMRNIMQI